MRLERKGQQSVACHALEEKRSQDAPLQLVVHFLQSTTVWISIINEVFSCVDKLAALLISNETLLC